MARRSRAGGNLEVRKGVEGVGTRVVVVVVVGGYGSRLPCYVFCICLLTYKDQKYKSVELGDQLAESKSFLCTLIVKFDIIFSS